MNRKGESFDGLWQQNDSPGGNVVSTSIDRKPKHVSLLLHIPSLPFFEDEFCGKNVC